MQFETFGHEPTVEREVIVSCHALAMEIERVQNDLGIYRPIVWVDRGLHNFPDQLRNTVQEALDSLSDVDRVLLGYANCGNAIKGIWARDFEIVIPKVDDCISILFGSQKERKSFSAEHASMFMTEGWMDADHSIVQEYEYTREKYGDEMAEKITKMMYAHYRTMTYLDTGLYDIDSLKERTKVICDIAELQTKVHPVGLGYVEELIAGPWPDNRFVHVSPNTKAPSF